MRGRVVMTTGRISLRVSLLGIIFLTIPTISLAEFDTEKGWDGHLFPSYIIAMATKKAPDASKDQDAEDQNIADKDGDDESDDKSDDVADNSEGDDTSKDDDADDSTLVFGESDGLLGVTLVATQKDQQVTVTISCDTIMEPSTLTCTLPESGKSYSINPKIKYKYDQLAKRTQTGPINVSYNVKFKGEPVEETSETLTLRSINDCPLGYLKNGEYHRLDEIFAAYVNEQHPYVDKILREALDTNIVNEFVGYQATEIDVVRQVYAIWHALSLRDVRYSSITSTAAHSETVFSQHVRLIDESINNGQANCVDGSVLLASLLRKIEIEPRLVRVPGHCFLGFYINEKHDRFLLLETTVLGEKIPGDLQGEAKKLKQSFEEQKIIPQNRWQENSWKTFVYALKAGDIKFDKEKDKPWDYPKSYLILVNVAEARKSGILPIAFQSNREFSEVSKKAR